MDIECENPSCRREFGPAVGKVAIVSTGRNVYALEGVMAVECEGCGHLTGTRPVAMSPGAVVAIICPGCGHKRGEVFMADGFSVFSSAGRTVYARRALHIQCGRCDTAFDPSEVRATLPPALSPKPRRGRVTTALIPRGITNTVAVGSV